MVKLKQLPRKGYAEIGQTLPIKFGFVNKVSDEEYEEVFVPFVCRDFFNEALWAQEHGKPAKIYGFSFDPKTQKFDTDRTRFSVTFPNEGAAKIFEDNWNILLGIEIINKLQITYRIKVDNLTYILEADPYWQSRGFLMSLFTGLIRWLSHPGITKDTHFLDVVEKAPTTDGGHLRGYNAAKPIKRFLENMRLMDKYDYGVIGCTSDQISTIHNNSGIMGVFYSPETSKYGPHLKELYNT